MATEIILSADESLESQLKAILALATELEHGHSQVNTAPRATSGDTPLPHGIVVTVPDELAEAYAERRQAAAEAEKTPRKRAAKATKAAEKPADDKTPPATPDASKTGDSGEQTKE